MNKTVLWLALFLAGAAFGWAWLHPATAPPLQSGQAEKEATALLAREINALQEDVAALRQSQRLLQDLITADPVESQSRTESIPGQENWADLQVRLEALESQVTQLNQFTQNFDSYGLLSAMENRLIQSYGTLLDTNQALGIRLKHLAKLRESGHLDVEARQAVAQLYHQSSDLKSKGEVLSALGGETPAELRAEILDDLSEEIGQGNQSARFRYHAIEALEPMLPDPVVEEWLRYLSSNDPEPKIAARAGQSLGIPPSPKLPVKP